MTLTLQAVEVPKSILSDLKNEQFKVREDAQEKLLDWGRKQQEPARLELYRLSEEGLHPEIRQRSFKVLRTLVYEYYPGEGFIGIQMRDVEVQSPEVPEVENGVLVTQVLEGHGAETAGIKVKDIVIGIQGHKAPAGLSSLEFSKLIRSLRPTEKVTLSVLRENEVKKFTILLGRRPAEVFDPRFGGGAREKQVEEQAKEAYFQQWLEIRKGEN